MQPFAADPHHADRRLRKIFGFDRAKILRQFGDSIDPKTNAYQVRLDVGRTDLRHFGDWGLYFAYRYPERDSVLDAFTDSVFHEGGTDAEGWVVGATYGLASNTWLNLRWFSTDAIDGPPLEHRYPYCRSECPFLGWGVQ